MDVVLLIGILVVWITIGLVVFWLVRRPTPLVGAPAPQPDLVPAPGPELETRDVGGEIELWWPGGGKLATVSRSTGGLAGSALRSPWIRRSVATVLRRALPSPGRKERYRITFPPDLMDTISSGGSVDIVLAGGSLSRLGAGTAAAGPAVALAAGAAAVSVAQQQRLDRTLAVIEQRLDLVIDRMRDSDHGRLDASEALLEQLEQRPHLSPSAQLRTELAVARHEADGVYFARRRFVERLGDAIGDAQEAATDEGEAQTWAAGVLDAVGDPEQLRSELLVYLRALVVRARLATSTAGVLAADGDTESASRLLDATIHELRDDFYAIYRRLRPLATWAPKRGLPWKRKDWDRAHAAVVEVFELMANEVEPSLPGPEPVAIAIEVTTDDEGEVDEVSIVD